MIVTPPTRLYIPPVGARVNWHDPLARGLEGYWLFNEGSGEQVTDITGHGWTLTPGDPGVWRYGRYGVGMEFRSSQSEWLQTTGLPVTSDPMTMIVWFQRSTISTWNAPVFLGATNLGANFHALTLATDTGTYTYYHRAGATQMESWVGPNPDVNDVVMMAGVSATNTNHRLYVNGVLRDSGNTADSYTDYDCLAVGSLIDSTPSWGNGTVLVVMIFKRALAADEIQRLYTDPHALIYRAPIILTAGVDVGGGVYDETVSVEASAASSIVDTVILVEAVGVQAQAEAPYPASSEPPLDLLCGAASVAAAADAIVSVADTQISIESVGAQADAMALAADTITVAEVVAAAADAVASAGDAMVMAEVVLATTAAEASGSATAVFAEAVSVSVEAIADAIDSFAASEVVSTEAQAVSSVVDTAISTDAVSAQAQAECSALDSNAPSEVVSVEGEAAASSVDSLICMEAVAVPAEAQASAVDAAAYSEVVAIECFGVTTVADTGVFAEAVLAEADAASSAIDTIPALLGLIHPFLLIQKTR